jgi:hypothetical protein
MESEQYSFEGRQGTQLCLHILFVDNNLFSRVCILSEMTTLSPVMLLLLLLLQVTAGVG